MKRIIFHIDVNSAYLSWEAVYRLQHGETEDIRHIPSVVGGDPKTRHGIVLAKSIPAKKFNIHTGESLMEARKKCGTLAIFPPRYSLYLRCSNALVDIISRYSPKIQRYSIDECFVDMTDSIKLFGDPLTLAHRIRMEVRKELGFTVSIGISSNKLLAKMGSDLKKPDAVTTLFPEEIASKMWPLPVGDLFMVGRATVPKLANMGILTIGDLAHAKPDLLRHVLKSHGDLIWHYAHGIDSSLVSEGKAPLIKSIGNSTTIAFDVDNEKEALLILLSLCEMVGMRLRETGYFAKLVSIHIKSSTFDVQSHQEKCSQPTNSTLEIYERACTLFRRLWKGQVIRHLGVSVSDFCLDDFFQLHFWDDGKREKQQKLDATLDQLRSRFNHQAVFRGTFVGSGIKPVSGGVSEPDFPMMSSLL